MWHVRVELLEDYVVVHGVRSTIFNQPQSFLYWAVSWITQSYVRRYGDFNCIMLKEWNLQQVLVYSLAIIVWVNNFQPCKIQVVLSSFFERVMILYVVVIGVVGGGWRVA